MKYKNNLTSRFKKQAPVAVALITGLGFGAETMAQDTYPAALVTLCKNNATSVKTGSVAVTIPAGFTPSPILYSQLSDDVTPDSNGNAVSCSVCHNSTDELNRGTTKKNQVNATTGVSWITPQKTAYEGGTATRLAEFCAPVANSTPTPAPTATPTPRPTATPTAAPTATPTPRPTATPTAAPTATPKPTGTPMATATPKPSTTPKPSMTPAPTSKNRYAPTLDVSGGDTIKAMVGQKITIKVSAKDRDKNLVELSATFGGLSLSGSTSPSFTTTGISLTPKGEFVWTPEMKDAGSEKKAKFTAKDQPSYGESKKTSETVTIKVQKAMASNDGDNDDDDMETMSENVAPVLSAVPQTMSVAVGETLTLPLSASDANGDKLDIRISGKKPGNSKLMKKGRNAETGLTEAVFSYTPKASDAGKKKRVKFSVCEKDGKNAKQTSVTTEIQVTQ